MLLLLKNILILLKVKTKLFTILLFLFSLAVFSQNERKLLKGQVVADSIKVENISVKNITSNISAITDDNGNFTIYARVTDTLYFSSITFRPAMLVLTREHMDEAKLLIKLDINITVLDEVIITPLTGDLAKDSRNTKTLQINTQFDSGETIKNSFAKETLPVNKALPQTESQLQGVNFVKIYDMIFKKKEKEDTGIQYLQGKTFTDIVKERYSHHFFTNTLNIPHDEIGLFLNFCDKGKETNLLLNSQKEFELTDYLVEKAEEYNGTVEGNK